jgi:glycosyltransferase involved in cell wall biosynthesis
VMKEHNYTYEVIFVNDGSTDNSWEVIEELKQRSPHVRGIKFRRNYGKSPGLHCGFQRAKGDVVITMDADLQDSPDEIPELYRMITEDGYPAGKRKDMTRCLRRSPRNYSTQQLVNSRE